MQTRHLNRQSVNLRQILWEWTKQNWLTTAKKIFLNLSTMQINGYSFKKQKISQFLMLVNQRPWVSILRHSSTKLCRKKWRNLIQNERNRWKIIVTILFYFYFFEDYRIRKRWSRKSKQTNGQWRISKRLILSKIGFPRKKWRFNILSNSIISKKDQFYV